MHLIDAVELEREGWYLNRIIQTDKNTMEYQTKKPTEFPAIEPERKTGEWFFLDECANEGVYCSRCSKKVFRLDFSNTMQKWKNFKFCPNCGADMRGEPE